VDGDSLWLALAFMLVLEGMLPFLSPGGWRRMFEQILLSDGQIRFFGLCSMLLGLALHWFLFLTDIFRPAQALTCCDLRSQSHSI
jgi:uncharacterized protein YjeT (DUF2065 family)